MSWTYGNENGGVDGKKQCGFINSGDNGETSFANTIALQRTASHRINRFPSSHRSPAELSWPLGDTAIVCLLVREHRCRPSCAADTSPVRHSFNG